MRSKNKIQVDSATPEIYKAYCKTLVDKNSPYNIKKSKFTKILKECNSILLDLMMLHNFEFKIPSRLGNLSLKKRKINYILDTKGNLVTKALSVNYAETNKFWKENLEAKEKKIKIYHTNDHYDGYKVMFNWSKKTSYCKGLSIVQFTSSRYAKRKLAEYLKNSSLYLEFYEKQPYIRKHVNR